MRKPSLLWFTNLSKTCFWLFQNGLKILIAACDTGAIEQLRVYVALGKNSMLTWIWKDAGLAKDCYGGDICCWPIFSKINKGGTSYAKQRTNNASVSEISVNILNKIVFVGEALVGNEAVSS
ncbi:hypothetical protein RhiirA4_336690 [Rhizophagus irregularis]|uniref:Uncharacterized protein n=1 Tax=Rhizophagus irregularis TaxID=588596 RepID=A0A2I1FWD0_9GLOM|nr:hypothetical protein RhiirA4_336690 [Rhizophagus irregularis]